MDEGDVRRADDSRLLIADRDRHIRLIDAADVLGVVRNDDIKALRQGVRLHIRQIDGAKRDLVDGVEHRRVAGERDAFRVDRDLGVLAGRAAAVEDLDLQRHVLIFHHIQRHIDRADIHGQIRRIDRISVLVAERERNGIRHGFVQIRARDDDLCAVDGTDHALGACDLHDVIVKRGLFQHVALGHADAREVPADLDRHGDLLLHLKGDGAGASAGDGDARVLHGVWEVQVVAHGIAFRRADARHIDDRRDLVLLMEQLVEVGVLSVELRRNGRSTPSGDDKALILPQDILAGENDRNTSDGAVALGVDDRDDIDPEDACSHKRYDE